MSLLITSISDGFASIVIDTEPSTLVLIAERMALIAPICSIYSPSKMLRLTESLTQASVNFTWLSITRLNWVSHFTNSILCCWHLSWVVSLD